MSQVNIPLDPTKTSRETLALEAHLRKLIVGQDEAVREITSMYQKDLVGMSAPGPQLAAFFCWARRDRAKPGASKRQRRRYSITPVRW
jgi:ATP-dependent Clp protease ATP-binding subunit ClpA